jgi:hypothetical protein
VLREVFRRGRCFEAQRRKCCLERSTASVKKTSLQHHLFEACRCDIWFPEAFDKFVLALVHEARGQEPELQKEPPKNAEPCGISGSRRRRRTPPMKAFRCGDDRQEARLASLCGQPRRPPQQVQDVTNQNVASSYIAATGDPRRNNSRNNPFLNDIVDSEAPEAEDLKTPSSATHSHRYARNVCARRCVLVPFRVQRRRNSSRSEYLMVGRRSLYQKTKCEVEDPIYQEHVVPIEHRKLPPRRHGSKVLSRRMLAELWRVGPSVVPVALKLPARIPESDASANQLTMPPRWTRLCVDGTARHRCRYSDQRPSGIVGASSQPWKTTLLQSTQ